MCIYTRNLKITKHWLLIPAAMFTYIFFNKIRTNKIEQNKGLEQKTVVTRSCAIKVPFNKILQCYVQET